MRRSTSRYADLEKPKKKKTLSATTSLVSIPNTIKLSMLNSGLLSFGKLFSHACFFNCISLCIIRCLRDTCCCLVMRPRIYTKNNRLWCAVICIKIKHLLMWRRRRRRSVVLYIYAINTTKKPYQTYWLKFYLTTMTMMNVHKSLKYIKMNIRTPKHIYISKSNIYFDSKQFTRKKNRSLIFLKIHIFFSIQNWNIQTYVYADIYM